MVHRHVHALPAAVRTITGVLNDDTFTVHHALGGMYGAAAAVLRGDQEGARLLISDLTTRLDPTELLVGISIATLERLHVALTVRSVEGVIGVPRHLLACEMLEVAEGFVDCDRRTVRTAAWRLDSVRRGDGTRARAQVRRSCEIASTPDLALGATSLLAATLCIAGSGSTASAQETAADLCLAAVMLTER